MSERYRALDLFCGAGGASMGLYRAGFDVTGVDWNNQPRYPFKFRLANALYYPLEGFDFIWASPICQPFSLFDMQMFFPHPPYPEEAIQLFSRTWARLEESGVLFVMENVRAAQRFVGRSVNHCGPFHMWGNAVPAIFPRHLYTLKKGIRFRRDASGKRILEGQRAFGSKSPRRKEFAATMAMIPVELGEFIGKQAIEYLRRKAEAA
jgi:C-5 cytosine-specific DNA methylase